MGSIEFMSACLSQVTATRGKGQVVTTMNAETEQLRTPSLLQITRQSFHLSKKPAQRLNQNNMAGPAALVVPALKKHTATVIWAHGLGDRWVDVQLH